MTHTPGPWRYVPSDDARIDDRIEAVDGRLIARGSITLTDDARLIASAPELRAALRAIVDHFKRNGDPTASELMDAGRAAIAKAEGQS